LNTIIPTDHGYNLFAQVFFPEVNRTSHHVLIINSAIGIGMEFYFPFARYVSSIGITTITYDYHANTPGARSTFRDFNAAVVACGASDFEAVMHWTEQMFAGHSIHVVGHGMGGAISGLAKSLHKVKTLINIGVQAPRRSEIPKKYWITSWAHKAYLRVAYFFSRSFIPLAAEKLASPRHLVEGQIDLRLLSPDIDAKLIEINGNIHFESFTGRLLTAIIPDEIFFNAEATERFHFQFKNAKKAFRFLYPEELDIEHVGFFGFFISHGSQSHWEMTTNWMIDSLPIHEDKYAIFHDEELPILVIEIAHRDPTFEMMEAYVETLKQYFQKGHVYMIMDMSRVHWANARFLKRLAEWVKQNRELIKRRHKGTAYACANPFIRYFISIFHAMDVFSVIKPVVVFKTVDQAKKWARLRMEEESRHHEVKSTSH
jgi:hypothetical protein